MAFNGEPTKEEDDEDNNDDEEEEKGDTVPAADSGCFFFRFLLVPAFFFFWSLARFFFGNNTDGSPSSSTLLRNDAEEGKKKKMIQKQQNKQVSTHLLAFNTFDNASDGSGGTPLVVGGHPSPPPPPHRSTNHHLQEYHLPYQRFLTSLSLRPGNMRAILAHLLPNSARTRTINCSSSSDHATFFNSGLRWLCQRSLHCFPTLPGKKRPMKLHLVRPCCSTKFCSASSSSGVQDPLPLTTGGFKTLRQCAMHCSWVFSPPTASTIFTQFLDLCTLTATCNACDSSLVHVQGGALLDGARWAGFLGCRLLDAAVEVGGVWALFFLALEADALEELLVLWVFKEVMTERSGSNVEIIPDMKSGGRGWWWGKEIN